MLFAFLLKASALSTSPHNAVLFLQFGSLCQSKGWHFLNLLVENPVFIQVKTGGVCGWGDVAVDRVLARTHKALVSIYSTIP